MRQARLTHREAQTVNLLRILFPIFFPILTSFFGHPNSLPIFSVGEKQQGKLVFSEALMFFLPQPPLSCTFGRNFSSWPGVGEDASLRTSAHSCAALVLTLSPDACRRVVIAVRSFVFESACGGKKFVASFLRISITYKFICILFIGVCTKETENESEMMWYRERVRRRERLFMRVHICTFPGHFCMFCGLHEKSYLYARKGSSTRIQSEKNANNQSFTDSVFAFTSCTRDSV